MSTSERQKIIYNTRKENGICVRCGKNNVIKNKTLCVSCAENLTLAKKETREYLADLGLCITCGKRKAEPKKKSCYECLGKEQDKYYEKRASGTYTKQKADI